MLFLFPLHLPLLHLLQGPALQSLFLRHLSPQQPPAEHCPRSSQHCPLGLGEQVPGRQAAKQETAAHCPSLPGPEQTPSLQTPQGPALQSRSFWHLSPQHPPDVHLPRLSQHSPPGLGEQVPGWQAPKHLTDRQSLLGGTNWALMLLHATNNMSATVRCCIFKQANKNPWTHSQTIFLGE